MASRKKATAKRAKTPARTTAKTAAPKRASRKTSRSAAKSAAKLATKSAAESVVKAARNGVAKKAAKSTTTTSSDSIGASTIIYVHGIGNKPPASILKAQWDRALFEFDLGERSRMAYWVDRERYPVPLEEVSTGGDYADGSEAAPTGEFSPRAVRQEWDPAAELRQLDADVEELTGSPSGSGAKGKDEKRLLDLAARMLRESNLTDDAAYQRSVEKLRGPEGASVRRIQAQRYGATAVKAKIFSFLPRPMRQWMTRNVTRMFLRDVNDLFVDKDEGRPHARGAGGEAAREGRALRHRRAQPGHHDRVQRADGSELRGEVSRM